MKNIFKLLTVTLVLLIGFSSNAQYKRWSLEASFGANNVSDQSATIRDNEYLSHYEGAVRYNFSPTFGLGGYVGYSDLNLRNFEGNALDSQFGRFNISAVVDVFDIVDMRNDTFTLLAHSGPGVSYLNNRLDDQYTFNISNGITGLFKLSNKLALKVDYTMTAQFDQANTLDGFFRTRNTQTNSFVNNLSVGLAFYLNNDDEDEEHADWYVRERLVDTVYIKQFVKERTIVTTPVVTKQECDCILNENVFFEHDSDVINKTGLNALAKTIDYVNSGSEIIIVGYASNTKSSSEYNMDLSKRRANNVKRKLVEAGANPNKIKVTFKGKDFNKEESVHDLARTVKIIVR
jgi:outer membrane protein OmpA-like peptidoglycan-associated protein